MAKTKEQPPDIDKILAKVKAGKRLTRVEQEALQIALYCEQPGEATFANNAVELAAILGVDRRTVTRHKKIPGNPGVRPDGRYNVAAWRKYLAEFGAAHGVAQDDESLADLKRKNMKLQNSKLERQLAILNEDYFHVSEIKKWGAELGDGIRKEVSRIHLLAPSIVGSSLQQAERILLDSEVHVLTQLSQFAERLSSPRRAQCQDEPAN